MDKKEQLRLRLERQRAHSADAQAEVRRDPEVTENKVIDCGWGRLLFGQTFADPGTLVDTLCKEQPNRRDIALYIPDPHVAVSLAPQEVFLDPSHTFRLWLDQYRPVHLRARSFNIRLLSTPEDAEACAEAGVRLVAVSNHGGRVLDHTPGVAEVLPEIVERVADNVVITADGGIRTGYDVFKMLALGADAVLLGRDVIRAAVGAGSIGVRLHMERMHQTLKKAMVMTGCPDLSSIKADVLV